MGNCIQSGNTNPLFSSLFPIFTGTPIDQRKVVKELSTGPLGFIFWKVIAGPDVFP